MGSPCQLVGATRAATSEGERRGAADGVLTLESWAGGGKERACQGERERRRRAGPTGFGWAGMTWAAELGWWVWGLLGVWVWAGLRVWVLFPF